MIITTSASELNTTQDCARKYQFSRVLGLNTNTKALPLEKGSFVHSILEHFYNLRLSEPNGHYSTHVHKTIEYGRSSIPEFDLSPEIIEEVLSNFREYALYYQSDRWIPLFVEAPFSMKLLETPELTILFEGKLDLIAQTPVGKTIIDHKSESKDEDVPLVSNQFMGYAYVGREMGMSTGDRVIVIANRLGFQKSYGPEKKFHRQVLTYPFALLDEWKESAIHWVKETIRWKDEGYYPPRMSSCKWCAYKEICGSDPSLRSWKMEHGFTVRTERHDLFKK